MAEAATILSYHDTALLGDIVRSGGHHDGPGDCSAILLLLGPMAHDIQDTASLDGVQRRHSLSRRYLANTLLKRRFRSGTFGSVMVTMGNVHCKRESRSVPP